MKRASQVLPVVKNPPANAGDLRDAGSIPGSGWSPGGGPGNPLQCSCLENPMDRGAWGPQSMGSQRVGHAWSNWARVHVAFSALYLQLGCWFCPGIILASRNTLTASAPTHPRSLKNTCYIQHSLLKWLQTRGLNYARGCDCSCVCNGLFPFGVVL